MPFATAGLAALPKFISFAPPCLDDDEISLVTETLRSGWLTTGPGAEHFEQAMSAYLGTEDSLALSSCTAALHLALQVLDTRPGHGVITTPLTFVSTVHTIVQCGARPFLIDVSPDTGNLDPLAVRSFLENECHPGQDGRPVHQNSGVVITTILPVHYGGHPVDLPAFWEIAMDYHLNIIEDAAHATGSFINGLPIGHPDHKPKSARNLKNLVAFSFYATKNLATGEGGLLTSSDPDLLARARRLSAYGISDARRIWGRYAPKGTWIYDVAEIGYKYNFTDIQAALGLAQLKKLPSFLKIRAEHANRYHTALAPLGDLLSLPAIHPDTCPSWHLYPLRLSSHLKNIRDDFIESLRSLNIGTSVMFIPIHYFTVYQKILSYQTGDFPIAEDFFQREISLPISPLHSPGDIESVANTIASLLNYYITNEATNI